MELKNKTVLITGSSRGIGKAIAEAFAGEGAHVVINYFKSKKQAFQLAEKFRKKRIRTIPVLADVSKSEDLNWLVKTTINEFGRIDVLVNNAGVIFRDDLSKDLDYVWDKTLDTNLKSVYFLSNLVSEFMLKQKSGNIINIGSIAGIDSCPPKVEYGVSKCGVIYLTMCLAKKLAPHVRVNCISPGRTNTDMGGYRNDPAKRADRESKIPLRRINEPEDIAKVALFLASDHSRNITGQNIIVDGGNSLLETV